MKEYLVTDHPHVRDYAPEGQFIGSCPLCERGLPKGTIAEADPARIGEQSFTPLSPDRPVSEARPPASVGVDPSYAPTAPVGRVHDA